MLDQKTGLRKTRMDTQYNIKMEVGMITADGRSAVEVEIEQMQFTGLDSRPPIFGLDYADLPAEPEETEPASPPLIIRLIERLFGLTQPSI